MGDRPSTEPAPAAVLFSGGSDSTLAAALMLDEGRDVTLLTFDPGFVLFIDNSRKNAQRLQEIYPDRRIEHEIIDNKAATHRLLWSRMGQDLRDFGFNNNVLICLGCRMAMHARAVSHMLEHGIPYLVDGSIADQSTVPEQLPSVLERHREFYRREFGIHHRSPIYEESRSDNRLAEKGMEGQRNLKRQFILFDTQATCPFGVTADVYGRLIYALMPRTRERESERYCHDKYPLLVRYVRGYIAERGLDLDERIQNLRDKVERDGSR